LQLGREKAQQHSEETAAKLNAARDANETAENSVRAFAPIWSQAEQLDVALATARSELSGATAELATAETTLREKTSALAAINDDLTRTSEAHRNSAEQLQGQSARLVLVDRLDDARELLAKRGKLKLDFAEAEQATRAANDKAAQLQEEIASIRQKITEGREQRAELIGQVDERKGCLSALNEPSLQERDATLQSLLQGLHEAVPICTRHQKAVTDLARHETDHALAGQEADKARAEIAVAEADRLRDQTARGEILGLAELADEAVSAAAVHMRSLLVPDVACPVCGSTEHPHVTEPSALNDMALRLRRRREELDAALAKTALRLDGARSLLSGSEARLSEAGRGIEASLQEILATTEIYCAKLPSLNDLCVRSRIEGCKPDLDTETALRLTRLASDVSASRQVIADSLRNARELRGDIDRLQQQCDQIDRSIETITQSAEQKASLLRDTEIATAGRTSDVKALTGLLSAIKDEMTPFLAAAGLSVTDLDADPTGVAARWEKIAREYADLRDKIGQFEIAIQGLERNRVGATASLDHARTDVAKLEGAVEQRRLVEQGKSEARAALLDGEDTQSHRDRFNAALEATREALASASETKSASDAALQTASARLEDGTTILQAACQSSAAAEAAFNSACVGIERPAEQVASLIATDPEQTRALRARIQEMDRAISDAATTVQTRKTDLQRALEGFKEEPDAGTLTTAIETLNTEIAEMQKRSGVLAATLSQDDKARDKARNLSVEIATAKADLANWKDVDDAIGSANGDRFRLFVQGVTLDHLVRLANDHLNALSPRYRLARGATSDLTLHIIDRDMGDEVRGTRSLSGGERFLVSLALALALSGLEGKSSFVDTLFIDEGFGSLDAETLDLAIDALETLHGRGRKVGIITHVATMIERIAVQVRVEKRGAGRSEIRISDSTSPKWQAAAS